ncbi:MAG TPA: hypothetical protein PLY79_10455, partial [Ferruginibacter sp.]|nr:hypothetical protein [Ferruginibacter sp.]
FPVFLSAMLLAIGYTNTWVGAKLRLVAAFALEKGALVVEAAQLVVNNTITATATFLKNAYAAALIRSATATGIAAVAARLLAGTLALLTGPIGIVLGLVAALVTVFGVLKASANAAGVALSENAKKALALSDILDKAKFTYIDQIATINSWMAVLRSSAASADTKRKAIDELTKINKAFGSVVKDNVIDLKELEKVYNQVTAAIKRQAIAQASRDLTEQKQKRVTEVTSARMVLEEEFARGGASYADIKKEGLTNEVLNIIKNLNGVRYEGGVYRIYKGFQKEVLEQVNKLEEDVTNDLIRYKNINSKIENAISEVDKAAEAAAAAAAPPPETVFQRFARFMRDGGTEDDIKTLREDVAKQKAGLNILSKEYKDLVALEKQIEEFLNPSKGGRGRNSDETATDRLKTAYEQEKKLIETQFNDKTINEQVFNEKLVKLATDYREKKLVAIKAANKKEKEQQVSFNAELAKDQADANKKLFDILSQSLNRQLEENINQARRIQEDETDDPRISTPDKINAKLDFYERELNAKRSFDQQMTALEDRFGVDNVLLAAKRRDELAEIERQIRRTAYELAVASYEERMRLIEQFNQNSRSRIETETNNKTV